MSYRRRPDDARRVAEARELAFATHFAGLFHVDPVFMGDPVDGTVGVARYDHNGIASVVSLGIDRMRPPGGERVEVLCEVVDAQAQAAEVAVRLTIARILGRLGGEAGVLDPGDLWINATPYLAGTQIQGIAVVDESWSGRPQEVLGPEGEVAGRIIEIVMLTRTEAKRVAHDGFVPLLEAAESSPAMRFDVLRSDLVDPPAPLPDVVCVITAASVEHGVRWMQRDVDGRFLAISLTESPEYLDDPEHFEQAPMAQVVAGIPDLRGFVQRATPGDYAMLDDDGWTFGRLEDTGRAG